MLLLLSALLSLLEPIHDLEAWNISDPRVAASLRNERTWSSVAISRRP